MTEVGAGGVVITAFDYIKSFNRDRRRLTPDMERLLKEKLKDLKKNPMPSGLRFEKLQGYRNPKIYTIHLNGNYKVSFEINGSLAILRHVGTHNAIDRNP